jgi:hypothetical protein
MAGATGLEPATSGVTGRSTHSDINESFDFRCTPTDRISPKVETRLRGEPANADGSPLPCPAVILLIKPSGKAGRFHGYLGDELIVTSRQPFLNGARALLARGYDPVTPYNMRHANSGALSFVTTTVGHAAGLSVVDAAQGARFRKFAPSDEPLEEAAE